LRLGNKLLDLACNDRTDRRVNVVNRTLDRYISRALDLREPLDGFADAGGQRIFERLSAARQAEGGVRHTT
jgi:hypothetical protein